MGINNMSEYGDGTQEVIRHMESGFKYKIDGDGQDSLQIVFLDDEGVPWHKLELRTGSALAKELMEEAKTPGETMKEFAERCSVTNSTLSNATSWASGRTLTRDLALKIILMSTPLPTEKTVNHTMMVLGRPGLFTDTGDVKANRRNQVLINILEYAQNHSCPTENWLIFTQMVFNQLGDGVFLGSEDAPFATLSKEAIAEIDVWAEEVKKLRAVDYLAQRQEFVKRFASRRGLRCSKEKLMEVICKEAFISPGAIKNILALRANKNSKGSRESLINLAKVLGCTFPEVNSMLRKANHAILYPKSADKEEVDTCKMFLQI